MADRIDLYDLFVLQTAFAAFSRDESEGFISPSTLEIQYPQRELPRDFDERLNRLSDHGLIKVVRQPNIDSGEENSPSILIRITALGIFVLFKSEENKFDDSDNVTWYNSNHYFEELSKIEKSYSTLTGAVSLGGDSSSGGSATIPASDRLVPLNHNSPEYQDAVEKVDELISAIERTNSYWEQDVDHRASILAELKAGRRLLDAKFAEPTLLKRLLYSPITWILATVVAATITPIAAKAGDAIAKLIGL